MTFDDVRAIALAWPGVEDATSYGTKAKGVGHDERDMPMDAAPAVFYVSEHYRDWPTVLAQLSAAQPEMVRGLLLRH